MGAEREDTDPTARDSKQSGGRGAATEPGLGPPSTPALARSAAADPHEAADEEPAPVDFDALHAALGDPIDYDEMPSGPALEKGNPAYDADTLLPGVDDQDDEPHVDTPPRRAAAKQSSDSSGQSNATYASGPHTIPPTRAPSEDMNVPAVIVASDTDTVPSAPPQMTVKQTVQLKPFLQNHQSPQPPRGGGAGAPASNPQIPVPVGGGMPGHPSSGAHPASPAGGAGGGLGVAYPYTPPAFPAQQPARGVGPSRNAVAQMTMRMPDRPVNLRRQKTATIVVRARGPSTKQKLLAFMAMLLLVTACGIAVIIWRKPRLLGLDPSGTPSGTPSGAPSGGLGAGGPGATTMPSPPLSTAPPAPTASSLTAPAGASGASSAKKTAPKTPGH